MGFCKIWFYQSKSFDNLVITKDKVTWTGNVNGEYPYLHCTRTLDLTDENHYRVFFEADTTTFLKWLLRMNDYAY